MVTYQALSPGVYVEEVPPLASPIAGVGTSTPGFIGVIPNKIHLVARPNATDSDTIKNQGYKYVDFTLPDSAAPATPHFITTWSQFTKLFGDLLGDSALGPTADANPAIDTNQLNLAHAVYGFFNNGGAGCYVTRVAAETDLSKALATFAAIDEISMVAFPGFTSPTDYGALIDHCEGLTDRVAILDGMPTSTNFANGDFTALEMVGSGTTAGRPRNSSYAAVYFPWVQVFDPGTQLLNQPPANQPPPAILSPAAKGLTYVPPCGHIAGIWARVDNSRGVYKAPANEVVQGAVGLQWVLSAAQQKDLNPIGINIIRPLIGAIRVWGARTVGGNANGNFRYLSTRRYFNYLRKSIEQGTQWVVFEPNGPSLWKRIVRSVDEFLLNEWHNGALFGDTPKQAYFVRCDENTNPPEVRDAGEVVTEIGVAILQPAEWVVFRIQQTTGG
jgi:phage tail sheath protein FI